MREILSRIPIVRWLLERRATVRQVNMVEAEQRARATAAVKELVRRWGK